MADFESDIRIGVDTSQALAAIKNLQREISAFQVNMTKGSAAQAAQASKMQQELVSSINSTGKFTASFRNVKTTTEAFTSALEKNKLSLGQYFRYAGASTKTFGKMFSSEMAVIDKTARERVKDLQTQYIKLGRDASGAMRSIAVRPLNLDLEDLGTKTALAAQKQQILNQLLKQGSTNLLNFGKNTQWAGRQLMVGFTVPLTIFGGIAAKTFMELEEQVIKFKKVYGDLFTSDEERNQALKDIEDLAKSFTQYGIAVSDTIGLAAEAAAAGFGGIDLQRQTQEATRLSVLGQLDQQKALETTISLTNAFKLSSENLAESINFLNAVENQTVVSLDDITTAVPKVAPVIQSLGGDVKDLAFFLAAMKEGGVNASQGANALKSGLASLVNPTEKASAFLSTLGINIKSIIEGNVGDLKGTVLEFATALDGLDPLNRARAIEELFGKFQFARLSTLFDNVIGSGTQASRVLDLAGSSASDLATIAEKELGMSAASSMNKFKKSIEDLQLALAPVGELFLKIVTPFIDFATSVIDKFNNLDERVKAFLAGMVGLLGVIGPVALMTFGLLANGVANIIKGFIAVRSVFQKAGQQTQILGEQTDYMTQQQLEDLAVAASLEQAHLKLAQAFTSEASAVDKLTAAYERSIAKQRQFAAPGMKTSIGAKAKGYANGGLIHGPGSGTSDSIPAMVSDGEFIVSAKRTKQYLPLLQQIADGSVPGFASKKTGGTRVGAAKPVDLETPSQYMNVFAHINDALQMSVNEFVQQMQAAGKKIPLLVQRYVDQGLGDVKLSAYGGLGFATRQSFNEAMKPGGPGVDPGSFLQDYDERGLDKWQTSLKIAGLKMDDVADDLGFLNKEIADQVRTASELDDQFVVTDKVIAEFVENAMKKLRANGSRLAQGFDDAADKLTEIRVMPRQSELDQAGYTRDAEGYSVSPDGKHRVKAGRDKTENRNIGGVAKGRLSDLKLDPAMEKAAEDVGRRTVSNIIEGAQSQSQSSKNYKVVGARRASTNPAVRIGAIASQTPVMGSVATGEAYSVLTRQLTKASDAVEQSGERFTSINSRMMGFSMALSSVGMLTSMFGGEMNGLQNVVYGVSAAMMVLTSIIELAQMARLKEMAKGGAKGFLDIFKNKVIGSKIGDAVSKTTGKALFSGGAKSLLAGGLTGTFRNITQAGKSLWENLGGLTKGFLKFIPYVGIAIAAFEAFKLAGDLQEKQKQKIEGLGNTANLAADKLQYLADVTNTQINSQGLGGGYQAEGTSSIDVAEESMNAVNKLKEDSEEFRKQFEENLVAIASSAPAIAEASLASLAMQLNSSGFAPDVIAAIIEMLVKESGRTDLNLDFLSLNVDGTIDTKALKEKSDSAIEIVKQEVARYNEEVEAARAATQNLVYGEIDSVGVNTYAANTYGVDGATAGPDAGVLQAAQVAGAALGTQMSSLEKQFAAGTIRSEDFNSEMASIVRNFNSMDSAVRGIAIEKAAEAFGTDFVDALAKVNSESDKLLLLRAQASGVDFGIDEINGLNKANQGSTRIRLKLNKLIAESAENYAEETRQKELNDKAEVQTVDLAAIQEEIALNEKIIDLAPSLIQNGLSEKEAIEALTDAKWQKLFVDAEELDLANKTTENTRAVIAAYQDYKSSVEDVDAARAKGNLADTITNLQKQNDVLAWLTQNGLSTAQALDIIGDSTLYAAAAAYAGSQDFATFTAQMDQIKALSSSLQGGSGGAAKKSPYQEAIDKLKEQRNEIGQSINAYNRLRKAGFSITAAFNSAKDPVLATALATTKVGTKKWKELVGLIEQADRAVRQSKLLELIRDNKAGMVLKDAFTEITPLLSKLGFSLSDIEGILGNPDLAQAFVDDLKDGEINSREVLNLINQIPKQKRIDIEFNMATPEGLTSIFDEAMARQQEYFDVQERTIEKNHRGLIKTAENAVESAQDTIDGIQERIEGIQDKINTKQREIETTITRPIDKLNESISAIEREIELNFGRPIADLQEESSDLSHELELMDKQTEEINKRYDDQASKMEKIAEINAEVVAQDRDRLSVAEALSSGNAATVARAMREARIAEASRAREKAAKALEVAREREIAAVRSSSGQSREEIAERQFEISQKTYNLEELSEAKQREIRDLQDKIYNIELLRAPLLADIRDLEDSIFLIQEGELAVAEKALKTAEDTLATNTSNRDIALQALRDQEQAWLDLQLDVDAAKVASNGYLTSLEDVEKQVLKIKAAWSQVGTATTNSVTGVVTSTPTPTSTPANSGGGGGGGQDPQPPRTRTFDTDWATGYNEVLTRSSSMKSAISSTHSSAGIPALVQSYTRARANANSNRGSSTYPYFAQAAQTAMDSLHTKLRAYGFNDGGLVPGGGPNKDSILSMLTPGEFVVRRSAVDRVGAKNLSSINSGTYGGESVYNYSVNVNVESGANPDDIARTVMTQIKRIQSQTIRGNRF